MKMMMRLDKSQVKSLQKFTDPGTYSLKRSVAIMAGYKAFDAIVVGGAGGAAGNAITDTNNVGDRAYWYGGGGGGGAHVRAMGSLRDDFPDLSLETNPGIIVGATGSQGANSAENGVAGDGGVGGTSQFFTFAAPGGKGGRGARFDAIIRNQPNVNPNKVEFIKYGYGGDGGFNAEFPDTEGEGGRTTAQEIKENTGGIVYIEGFVPTSGSDAIGGSGAIVTGGGGGGGGGGRFKSTGAYSNGPQEGADAIGPGDYIAPGQETYDNELDLQLTASRGGRGGGVNFHLLTGVDEYAGGGEFPNGGVVIKLS